MDYKLSREYQLEVFKNHPNQEFIHMVKEKLRTHDYDSKNCLFYHDNGIEVKNLNGPHSLLFGFIGKNHVTVVTKHHLLDQYVFSGVVSNKIGIEALDKVFFIINFEKSDSSTNSKKPA